MWETIIGNLIGGLAKNAFQGSQKQVSPNAAITPEQRSLFSALAQRALAQLQGGDQEAANVAQQAYDVAAQNVRQSSADTQRAIENRLNGQGILDSGATLDANARLQGDTQNAFANLAAQAAQARLAGNQNAITNALNVTNALNYPGQLGYAAQVQQANQANQRLNNFAPLLFTGDTEHPGLTDILGSALDNFFTNRNTSYNPGASTVPYYRRQAQQVGFKQPKFGSHLGGF